MRVSFLLLITIVIFMGCEKGELVKYPCFSHSNLSLSINDSLRISPCDTIPIIVEIYPSLSPSSFPILDTTINQYDTLYVKFNEIGEYTLNYVIGIPSISNNTKGSNKEINVN